MPSLDLAWVRAQFPALAETVHDQTAIFFDGPGGTQVPQRVIAAIGDYLIHANANTHGAFATSARSDAIIADAHAAMADLLGCDPDEVVFGPNMTTFVMPSEIYPVAMRATGHGISAGVGKLGAFIGVFLFPLLETGLGLRGTLLLTAGVSVAGLALTLVLPEPSGRSLEEIAADLPAISPVPLETATGKASA